MRKTLLCAASVALVALGCDGSGPPDLDPGMRIYVAGEGDSRLHIFDLATLERLGELEVPAGPSEVHATPDGSTVWVVSSGAAQVTLIDTVTLESRNVGVGSAPVHSYIEPGYDRIWVGNDASADISVIDIATAEETRVLTGTGHHKLAFAVNAGGALSFAYVSNIADGTISVVDPSPALVTNVTVGPAPHGIDCSHETGLVYNCSGDDQNSIEVIDPASDPAHQIVSRIPLPARCGAIHAEEGGVAYATIGDMNLLVRIDLATETVTMFDAGDGPDKWAIVGDRAFVANTGDSTVTVIDLTDGTTRSIEVGMIHEGGEHAHRGIRHHGNRIFVPNGHEGSVSVIDVDTETVIGTLEGITEPSGIAVAGPEGGTTYPR